MTNRTPSKNLDTILSLLGFSNVIVECADGAIKKLNAELIIPADGNGNGFRGNVDITACHIYFSYANTLDHIHSCSVETQQMLLKDLPAFDWKEMSETLRSWPRYSRFCAEVFAGLDAFTAGLMFIAEFNNLTQRMFRLHDKNLVQGSDEYTMCVDAMYWDHAGRPAMLIPSMTVHIESSNSVCIVCTDAGHADDVAFTFKIGAQSPTELISNSFASYMPDGTCFIGDCILVSTSICGTDDQNEPYRVFKHTKPQYMFRTEK